MRISHCGLNDPQQININMICSWRSFLQIWNEYLPDLKIRSPYLHTCNLCNEYAKYIACKRMSDTEKLQSFLSNDALKICPETNEESLLQKRCDDLQETCEQVVLLASKHVVAARAQKWMAQNLWSKLINKNLENWALTLDLDYCKNLDIPHLGEEQSGDTYYFSPGWIYCLGIVDVTRDQLYVYICDEASAKKGTNNIASILLYHIITFAGNNFRYRVVKELNIVMGNCGG